MRNLAKMFVFLNVEMETNLISAYIKSVYYQVNCVFFYNDIFLYSWQHYITMDFALN